MRYGQGYVYYYFPEERLSIAVLCNLMVDTKSMAIALYQAYVEHQK